MPDFVLPGLVLLLATTMPVAWKWTLGLRRSAMAVAGLSLLTAVLIETTSSFWYADSVAIKVGANWIATLGAALGVLVYRFYRDPERTVPGAPNLIVSPADVDRPIQGGWPHRRKSLYSRPGRWD